MTLALTSTSGEKRLLRQRRCQLLDAVRSRYQALSYQEKTELVNELVLTLERHGHLEIEPSLKELLLQVSPATIDRLLAPARGAKWPPT